MNEFKKFLDKIDNPIYIEKMEGLLFSVAKQHIAVAPETVALDHFDEEIKKAGYIRSKMLFRIKWTDEIDFDLIDKMIEFNIEDKKDMTKFWR